MENTMVENLQATLTDKVIDEGEKTAEEKSALPSKFKSVDALIEAYNALEKEFTRRSQKLRELTASTTKAEQTENLPTQGQAPERAEFGEQSRTDATVEQTEQKENANSAKEQTAVSDDNLLSLIEERGLKQRIIQEYVSSVRTGQIPPLMTTGQSAALPQNKPKSFRQAGLLAAEYLKNLKNN